MQLVQDNIQLRGVEKAAVLFLCMQEERGSSLMSELSEDEVHMLTQAMSTLGTIPAPVVEGVIREFSDSVSGGSGVIGSLDAARRLLAGFMPASRVSEVLDDISGTRSGRSIWESFASLNDQVIANYLRPEHDQTVAAIMSKVKPDVAARVLPLFGAERMTEIVTRMMALETLPRHVLEEIEATIETEFLPAATRKSGPDPQQRLADMFNKMDSELFETLSGDLEQRAPQSFAAIKQKMFTFDDLVKLEAASLQRIMRGCEGNTLSLALRGAKKPVREAFMAALTQRARDMLQEEMEGMPPVRARDVREAQARIIDITNDLVRQDVIRLPSDDDQMIG